MTSKDGAVERLIELGFSQYEAQAYLGLLGREPLTGYALSNVTGIPQPKVYETLRRLTAKGVVAAMAGEPARYVAVPADQLLADLEGSFRARLAGAQRELATVTQARHVAVVADSADVVWALAEDGVDWQSVTGRDPLLAALAKGYIRHDIYVQQVWNEFHDVLAQRWGPGMQQLVGELSARPAAGQRTAARGSRRGRSA